MGFSQSSLAIKGLPEEEVLSILALRRTGEREEFPESEFVCASLRNGWFLVVAEGVEHYIISDGVLHQLSQNAEIVTCSVEEHVMFSESAGWSRGMRAWRVRHYPETGIEHLEAEGNLPPAFSAIKERCFAEQRAESSGTLDVDHIFEIPIELASSFTGYVFYEDLSVIAPDGFEVLESTLPPLQKKRSFLQRLFGL